MTSCNHSDILGKVYINHGPTNAKKTWDKKLECVLGLSRASYIEKMRCAVGQGLSRVGLDTGLPEIYMSHIEVCSTNLPPTSLEILLTD